MIDTLELRIRQVDPMADPGAPDPGSLMSSAFWIKVAEHRDRDRRRRRHGTAALVGITSVALAVGLALALVPGGIGSPSESAAAVALRTIADHIEKPVNTYPGDGIWLHRTMDFSIISPTTTIHSYGATPARSVTLSGVLASWVNGTRTCQSPTFQPAQFGSPRRQAAWQATGLEISETTGVHGYCTTAIGPTPYARNHPTSVYSDGILPIDVSRLSSKPAKLTKALATGTTGIPSLDKGVKHSSEAPFERAVLLLLAPTVGASPQFPAEVYRAIALLPHVVSLGIVWTHTGGTGQGFAASKSGDSVAMVVNRKGTLLEVRNAQISAWTSIWAQLVATSFLATSTRAESYGDPPLANQVWFRTSWIDPVGPPTSVAATAVPGLREPPYA
jgi:hypothetical protein